MQKNNNEVEIWEKINPEFKNLSEEQIINVLKREHKIKQVIKKRKQEIAVNIGLVLASISMGAVGFWGVSNIADGLKKGIALQEVNDDVLKIINDNSRIIINEETSKSYPALNHEQIAKKMDEEFEKSQMNGELYLNVLNATLTDPEYNMPYILTSMDPSNSLDAKNFLEYVQKNGFQSIDESYDALAEYNYTFNKGGKKLQ